MNLGRTIRNLREKAKLTQTELADLSNFKSFTSISQFETGRAIPRFDAIVRISTALGISPIEFYLLSCEPEDLYTLNDSRRKYILGVVTRMKKKVVTESLIKDVLNQI